MSDSYRQLSAFIDSVRRRLMLRFWLEAGLRLLESTFGLFLLAIGFFALGAVGLSLQIIFAVLLTACSVYLIRKFLWLPYRTYRPSDGIAAYVEARNITLSDRLLSAVQFTESEGRQQPYSPTLAKASVESVFPLLDTVSPGKLVPYGGLWRPMGRTLLTAMLIALLIWLAPNSTRGAFSSILGRYGAASFLSGEASFLAGDVNLTYTYPAYTGLDRLEVKNCSGDIEAYPGTQVKVNVRAATNAEQASLVMDEGGEISLDSLGQQRFEGTLSVAAKDSYYFQFDDVADSRARKILVLPDRSPGVRIAYPPSEMEVRETDQIEIAYEAEDDFGLSKIELVMNYDTGKGREDRRFPIESFEPSKRRHQSEWLWDLATLRFQPGDRVSYYIEATDNNSVSGPNKGRSATQVLKIFSMYEHHQKLIERQEQLWEGMLGLLAGYLENPPGQEKIKLASEVLKAFDDTIRQLTEIIVDPLQAILKELKDDPLSTEAVQHMLGNMFEDFLAHRDDYNNMAVEIENMMQRSGDVLFGFHRLNGLREGSIQRLEKYIMELYELLQKQKYDALVHDSEKLAQMRDELRRLLEEYKATGNEQLKERIQQLMAEFRKKMEELAQKMAQIRKEIPEEFVNMESMDTENMNQNLDSLEQMLANGDLERALQQLEQMSQQLNQLLDNLKEGSEQLGESLYSEAMKKMMNAATDLAQLKEKEENLQRQTMAQQEQYKQQMAEAMKKNFEQQMDKLAQKVKSAKAEAEQVTPSGLNNLQAYRDRAIQNMQDLLKSMENQDVRGSLDVAEQAMQNLNTLQAFLQSPFPSQRQPQRDRDNRKHAKTAQKNMKEVLEQLKNIMPDPNKLMDSQQKAQMQQMRQNQEELLREGYKLNRDISELMDEVPFMPQNAMQQMHDANQGMERSRENLQKLQPGPAQGQQQQAIHQLQQLQDGMQQAMQQMQSGMKFGGMKPNMRDGQRPGGRQLKQEKVVIPQAEEYRTPKELREDLLEAMKRKAPEDYTQQNKQYYKELVK